MEAYQAVLLALVALLVGALLPVLYQVAATLRAVRETVAQATPAIASLQATVERVERLTARLEETASTASKLGAAVIPAVAAAVQAWRASHDGAAADGAPAPEAAGAEEAP